MKDDEILQENIERYGEVLGEAYHYVHNQWCDTWWTYNQYRTLFGTNQERIELLNKHSGPFFYNVERHFWNATIMSVCRLTDPFKQGSNRNLSLECLIPLLDNDELRGEVKIAIKNAKEKAKFARERRSKLLAHSDFDITTKKAEITTSASRRKMSEVISSIHEPLRIIAYRIADVDTRPFVLSSHPNELDLLYSLYESSFGKEHLNKLRQDAYLDNPHKQMPTNFPYPDWLIKKDPDWA